MSDDFGKDKDQADNQPGGEQGIGDRQGAQMADNIGYEGNVRSVHDDKLFYGMAGEASTRGLWRQQFLECLLAKSDTI